MNSSSWHASNPGSGKSTLAEAASDWAFRVVARCLITTLTPVVHPWWDGAVELAMWHTIGSVKRLSKVVPWCRLLSFPASSLSAESNPCVASASCQNMVAVSRALYLRISKKTTWRMKEQDAFVFVLRVGASFVRASYKSFVQRVHGRPGRLSHYTDQHLFLC